jgi:hypothetical protein
MNLAILALALLGCLVLAVSTIIKHGGIGESHSPNSLPLPWFRHAVNIPPMPERAPSIGMANNGL